jgi:MFS family permease
MYANTSTTVNVIAYYSTSIFKESGFSRKSALAVSVGVGALNFLGALPAVLSIDRFGRRNLLLVTFPMLSVCLFCAALGFLVENPTTRTAIVATSIYVFMLVYSPGMGPVPFTYSAEAFPLHIRALGMSSATAITWAFNFVISFSWPRMNAGLKPTGSFLWYAGWNIFGFVFTYFLLPETKNRTLEELYSVFSMRNRDHALYYTRRLARLSKKMLRRDVEPMAPLYNLDNMDEQEKVSSQAVTPNSEQTAPFESHSISPIQQVTL